jgi:hypothetical protein
MTKKNDNIETEYWEVIELTDPITGKKFSQKVKIIKYKTPNLSSKSIADELEDTPIIVLPDDSDQE